MCFVAPLQHKMEIDIDFKLSHDLFDKLLVVDFDISQEKDHSVFVKLDEVFLPDNMCPFISILNEQ